MRYIGAINPEFPTNAFMVSIYQDDAGTRYEHEAKDDRIEKFTQLKGTAGIKVRLTDEPVEVAIGEPPIYSYVKQDGTWVYGHYNSLFLRLVPLIFQSKLNSVAKIILTSFFNLHGRTSKLVDDLKDDPLIVIKKDLFLPYESMTGSQLLFESLLAETISAQESMAQEHGLELADLIYNDGESTFIGNYKVSQESLQEYIDGLDPHTARWETMIKLLMKYATNGYQSFVYKLHSIFTNDSSCISQQDFYRTRETDYRTLGLQYEAPAQSLVALSFAAENKMYVCSLSRTEEPDLQREPAGYIAQIAQLVKDNIKRQSHDLAFTF